MRLISGIVFWGIGGFLFFRRSRGLGKLPFILLSLIFTGLFYFSPFFQLFTYLFLIFALILALITSRKPSREYQQAVARVEGGGIKRGLLPPEAAILLGSPFNLTLVLVLFGMLKKGILKHVTDMPWKIEIGDKFKTNKDNMAPKRRTEIRRESALVANILLLKYEELFLELFEQSQGMEASAIDFSIIVKPLIKHVANRVAGYDLEKTREYYNLIIERAHLEARGGGVMLSEREAIFDRNLEWILLNENLDAVFTNDDFKYFPIWMRDRDNLTNELSAELNFKIWILRIIEQMREAIPPENMKIIFEGESENVLAGLLSDISRATFYG
jgi:hypothetical protein